MIRYFQAAKRKVNVRLRGRSSQKDSVKTGPVDPAELSFLRDQVLLSPGLIATLGADFIERAEQLSEFDRHRYITAAGSIALFEKFVRQHDRLAPFDTELQNNLRVWASSHSVVPSGGDHAV